MAPFSFVGCCCSCLPAAAAPLRLGCTPHLPHRNASARCSYATPSLRQSRLSTSSVEDMNGEIGAAAEQENTALSMCKACGRDGIERGCNGEGRIQGGIGVVPGFGWWPIKAYKPCPSFIASGGKYKRKGQSLDELAFGRQGLGDDLDISERLKGR